MVHAFVYEQSKELLRLHSDKPILVRCVSAGEVSLSGFVDLGKERKMYSGESTILGIKCHPNTEMIMNNIYYISVFNKNNNPFKLKITENMICNYLQDF